MKMLFPNTFATHSHKILTITLYNTPIVTINQSENTVKLNFGEFPTRLTRTRINDVLFTYGIPYVVFKKRGKYSAHKIQRIADQDNPVVIPFNGNSLTIQLGV